MDFFVTLISTALSCAVLLVLLSRYAPAFGLLDSPDTRKKHTGKIPLVGGIAVFASAAMWLLIVGTNEFGQVALLAGFAAMLLGVLDDKLDLSARLRLTAQVLIAFSLAVFGSLSIVNLGDVFGIGPVILGATGAAIFTVFCFVGVLNAMNMSDGVDGLLGLVSLSTLAAIGWLCYDAGKIDHAQFCMYFIAALIPYLIFNLGLLGAKRRIFLGDGGSMMLGLVLVALFIRGSQGGSPAFSATTAGWLLGLPLLDSVAVMVRRVSKGQSPFAAGRDHFHHLLLDSGLGPRKTVAVLVMVHWAFLAIGMISHYADVSDSIFFWLFVLVTILHFIYTPRLVNSLRGNWKSDNNQQLQISE